MERDLAWDYTEAEQRQFLEVVVATEAGRLLEDAPREIDASVHKNADERFPTVSVLEYGTFVDDVLDELEAQGAADADIANRATQARLTVAASAKIQAVNAWTTAATHAVLARETRQPMPDRNPVGILHELELSDGSVREVRYGDDAHGLVVRRTVLNGLQWVRSVERIEVSQLDGPFKEQRFLTYVGGWLESVSTQIVPSLEGMRAALVRLPVEAKLAGHYVLNGQFSSAEEAFEYLDEMARAFPGDEATQAFVGGIREAIAFRVAHYPELPLYTVGVPTDEQLRSMVHTMALF